MAYELEMNSMSTGASPPDSGSYTCTRTAAVCLFAEYLIL